MQKHPRIKSGTNSLNCPFSNQVLLQHMQLSPYAFNRHLRKSSFRHSPTPSIKVYQLPCSCFVWVYASGIRQLSALPF